jgi:hypothetical protein
MSTSAIVVVFSLCVLSMGALYFSHKWDSKPSEADEPVLTSKLGADEIDPGQEGQVYPAGPYLKDVEWLQSRPELAELAPHLGSFGSKPLDMDFLVRMLKRIDTNINETKVGEACTRSS